MAKGRLRIGWNRGIITPPRKTLVQGQFHARLSEKTISPLTATALAIEVGDPGGTSDHVVFLSCDLASESVRSDVIAALEGRYAGLDTSKLTINTTHTHTGPCLQRGMYPEPEGDPDFMNPDECRLWVAEKLAGIVAGAWEQRECGTVSRGFGYAVVGRCRRAVYADGTALMYGSTEREDFRGFEACDDHAVNMLFTHSEKGGLTGVVVNLACPAQCDESISAFSADFWHNVRESIAERYGQAVHLLPQCAPAGDMSPHLLADRKEEKDLRDRLGVDDKGIIARRIMTAVDDALAHASPRENCLELVHVVKTVSLPRLCVTAEQYETEKRIPGMSEDERNQQPFGFNRIWPFGNVCDLVTRYEQQGDKPRHEIDIHVIRLGDVVFATNPFELFVDYGMRIRCRSKALQTFLVQLADGSDEKGYYLPTERALRGGHYSALIKSNWVGPEGGTMLVEETLHTINELFGDASYPGTR